MENQDGGGADQSHGLPGTHGGKQKIHLLTKPQKRGTPDSAQADTEKQRRSGAYAAPCRSSRAHIPAEQTATVP